MRSTAERQGSSALYKILTVLALFTGAAALIALGWLLHPSNLPPTPGVPAAHRIAGQLSTTTRTDEITTMHTPASITKIPSAFIPATSRGQTPSSAPNVSPRPAPYNINPDAPDPSLEHADDTPIDGNRALDLFARQIAKAENREEDSDQFDIPHLRRRLETALPNLDATSILQADLESWASQFSPKQQAHFAIVLAECRGSVCRILIAINGVQSQVVGNAIKNIFPVGIDPRTLLASMMAQPWWQPMTANEYTSEERGAGSEGYALISVYFKLLNAR